MLLRLLNAYLGLWLVVAPGLLGYGAFAATNHRIAGLLIAIVEVLGAFVAARARALRFIATALGVWLVVSPALNLIPHDPVAASNAGVVGALVILLAQGRERIERGVETPYGAQ